MADAAPQVPAAPQASQQPAPQAQHIPWLNWSHLKPEFSGKPEEDAEAHIRQVTILLGYGGAQILEVFKNTLPTKFIGFYSP